MLHDSEAFLDFPSALVGFDNAAYIVIEICAYSIKTIVFFFIHNDGFIYIACRYSCHFTVFGGMVRFYETFWVILPFLIDCVFSRLYHLHCTLYLTFPDMTLEFTIFTMAQIERQFGAGSIMRLGSAASAGIEAISTGSLALGVIGLLSALFRYLSTLFNGKAGETLVKTARDSLYHRIEQLPWRWHAENPTGDIIQRCTSDVERIKEFFQEQFVAVFRIVVK